MYEYESYKTFFSFCLAVLHELTYDHYRHSAVHHDSSSLSVHTCFQES